MRSVSPLSVNREFIELFVLNLQRDSRHPKRLHRWVRNLHCMLSVHVSVETSYVYLHSEQGRLAGDAKVIAADFLFVFFRGG